jgi:hypothetical protein
MRRSVVLIGSALALAFATGGVAATAAPLLRSVSAANGHLTVTFTLARDQVPGRVVVATSRAGLSGPIAGPSVKLREAMHAPVDPATGLARWRTLKALPAGTYYVDVSGIQAVGITGCKPIRPSCLMHWSNSRRVVIR